MVTSEALRSISFEFSANALRRRKGIAFKFYICLLHTPYLHLMQENFIISNSSVVEHTAVNRQAAGSNPAWGEYAKITKLFNLISKDTTK